jgi:hypothetical protein
MISLNVNEWLDEYNDYMQLYKMFGDKQYLTEAVEIIRSLKAMIHRIEYNKKIVSCINNNVLQKF